MTAVRVHRKYSEFPSAERVRREWLVVGPPFGAVQYVEWYYPPESMTARALGYDRMPVDVGYHSVKPRYDSQESMSCHVIEGECYYDGSGLHAIEVKKILDNDGELALWAYLESYFAETFGCSVERAA